jgi:hypothetical protein
MLTTPMNRFAAMLQLCLLGTCVAAGAGCDTGRARPILESVDSSLGGAAGSRSAGSSAPRGNSGGTAGASGRGGAGGAGGGRSELQAGRGEPGSRPTDPCGDGMDPGGEIELTDALNASIDNKSFCPDNRGPGLSRLTPSTEWRCIARMWARGQATPDRGGRAPGPQFGPGWVTPDGGPNYMWVRRQSSSVNEAKSALLGDERGSDHRDELCDATQQTPYKAIGVGRFKDAWVIFVSPSASPFD